MLYNKCFNQVSLTSFSIYDLSHFEGGDAINAFNNSDIWVFGLSDSEKGNKNILTDLVGQSNAITNGLQFNATNQMSVRSIDTYTLYDGISGVSEAFYESSYGLVAVQFDGSDINGQKTFCMSYALADLEDGEGVNTRRELLSRILNFFDVVADVGENELGQKNHLRVYPHPAQTQITLQLYAEKSGNIEVEVFDLSGRKVTSINKNFPKGDHSIDFNISAFNSGVYYFRLRSGNQSETIKWIKVD